MAVIKISDLKEKLINHFSDIESDDKLEMIEDISDTLDAAENGGNGEWEKKYKDLEKKYIERFTKKEDKEEETEEEKEEETEDIEEGEEVTEEDIFEEKKKEDE